MDKSITRLITAVIQLQDEKKAINALAKAGFMPIELASTGAFLGQHNVTLMIGISDFQVQSVLEIIQKNCHERIEYISTPLESTPLPLPISTPVTVGGASVFMFDIERYEEI